MKNTDRELNILLDTNFLIVPFQFKIDLKSRFDELIDRKYSLILLNEVYEELVKIYNKARGKRKQEIKAAITYFKNKEKITILEKQDNESIDDLLIRIAKKFNYVVATNDKILKRRLKNLGINFIYVRQKSFFRANRFLG
ncbi:MAG: type II toxin-antitoxin system VapC family toxin [Candidatus Helarchaeota archaeon]